MLDLDYQDSPKPLNIQVLEDDGALSRQDVQVSWPIYSQEI